MTIPFSDLTETNLPIFDDFVEDLKELFEHGQFTLGPAVQKFEESFAKFIGCKFCVGTGSGTDALVIALRSLGIGPNDEVIVPAFGFCSTAEAVVRVGAKPVFVDVRPHSYTLDPDKTLASITSATRAIIPVHIFGHAAEIDRLVTIARTYSVSVIEDCRQMAGARFGHRRVGTYGEISVFSFHPNAPLGGVGDGGALLTNNENAANQARTLRDHGRAGAGCEHDIVGYYSLLDAINAIFLQQKLQDVDENNAANIANAGLYDRLLMGSPVERPPYNEDGSYIYNTYSVAVPDRDKLSAHLKEEGIGNAVFLTVPLHLQTCFQYLGNVPGAYPIAEDLCKRVISLPISPGLKKKEIESVANHILSFYGVAT